VIAQNHGDEIARRVKPEVVETGWEIRSLGVTLKDVSACAGKPTQLKSPSAIVAS
jgi:hypothetical protein